jgi:hypothetical protein
VSRRFREVFGVSHKALIVEGALDGQVDIDSRFHVDPFSLRDVFAAELSHSHRRSTDYFEKASCCASFLANRRADRGAGTADAQAPRQRHDPRHYRHVSGVVRYCHVPPLPARLEPIWHIRTGASCYRVGK